jgi:hypothetical protein
VNHSQGEERLKRVTEYSVYFQYIIPDNLDKYFYAIFIFHDLHNYPAPPLTRSSTKIIQKFTNIIVDIDTTTLIRSNIF